MFSTEVYKNRHQVLKRHIFEDESNNSRPSIKIKRENNFDNDQHLNFSKMVSGNECGYCRTNFNDALLSVTSREKEFVLSNVILEPEKFEVMHTSTNTHSKNSVNSIAEMNCSLPFCKESSNLRAPENPYYYEYNKLLFNLHIERVQRSVPQITSSPK